MYTLLPMLLIAAALGLVAFSRLAHRRRLRRLDALVQTGERPAHTAGHADLPPVLERFVPRGLLRNLHVLGIVPSMAGIAALFTGAAALTAMLAFLLGPAIALALAVVFCLLALMVLNLVAAKRITDLGATLPTFFDRVRQLLAIGNSLPVAFVRSVQGAPPRLAQFFAPAVRRISNGASFSESIAQSAEDMDVYEMRLFAAAVATNMRFGGSLTHSLANLISYLRKRAAIEREMRANTAQIRASAWLLALLPMLVAGLIMFQNRDYLHWFTSHPKGREMLAYCLVSQLAGMVLMRMVARTRF